ncbi:MAG: ABC transporter ATP-binding protein/permease [Chloroflexi bacterium]|nr:ABC transporter ATP-binding protein/permease [Chloroflexota bacterium]
MNGEAKLVVRARGLVKRYGSVEAVRGVDLGVRRGEIYGFLGPNGAGKTTTLLMLLGIVQPTAGTIEIFDRPAPLDPFRDKLRIGVMGEQQYLYDDLSAWEYLLYFGRLYRVADPEPRARALLERLDLDEFRRLRARDFSHGMQQKLRLALALIHQPDLLILDEPASGLDPQGIRQVREILAEENARGATILLSSHILSEVERTADRVGILSNGRLVAEDNVAQLAATLEPDALIELDVEQLESGAVDSLRGQPFVRAVELGSNGHGPDHAVLRVRVAPDADYRRAVSALVSGHGGLITDMRQRRLSLEDAFVRLTSEAAPVAERPPTVTPPPARHFPRPSTGPFRGVNGSPSWRPRSRTISVLGRRELLGVLYGPGPYVVVALGVLAALPVVAGYLDAVQHSGILVLADAFTLPFFVAATLATLFLALAAIATIARERDQGTLEVLFYGPVDDVSYILSKHLALVIAYVPMALVLGLMFLAYAQMTGLRLPSVFPMELLLSFFTAIAVTALGVCLATVVRGVRAGIALLAAVVGLFLAIRFGSDLLSGLQVTNNFNSLLFLRDLVVGLDSVVAYISPFSVFQSGVEAAVRSDLGGYLLAIAISCLQAAVLLVAAVQLLAWRGVRR